MGFREALASRSLPVGVAPMGQLPLGVRVRMAERSKALRSGRSLPLEAWVRIPLLTDLSLAADSSYRLQPSDTLPLQSSNFAKVFFVNVKGSRKLAFPLTENFI